MGGCTCPLSSYLTHGRIGDVGGNGLKRDDLDVAESLCESI